MKGKDKYTKNKKKTVVVPIHMCRLYYVYNIVYKISLYNINT